MVQIDGYRVGDVLGRGGMGTVYRAESVSDPCPVALKCVDRGLCGEHALGRFRQEAGAAVALVHPNVVRTLASGESPDGTLFLAMELLEGEDLASRLRRGPLSAPEVVRIGLAAAAGLGAAHAVGIVHRDIKPANIFLCADGGVKVLDFGLAITLAEAPRRVTQSGDLVGTPAYMAVEQVMGLHTEDSRTDVWGLGATLFRALAGRAPFHATTTTAQLVRVVNDEPDPLPEGTPAWLAEVILRALRKDKSERWADMGAFAAALSGAAPLLASAVDQTERLTIAEALGVALPLGDEMRLLSVLLAYGTPRYEPFAAAVQAEGGTPSILYGDRAVGVFGGDEWRGDEAERAVRSGLTFREADGDALLGVAVGRGLRATAGDITGAVVAAAERALAPSGVGADDEARRRIRGAFTVEGGIVTARRPGASVVGVRELAGVDVPLIGRDAEMALLDAAAQRAFDEWEATGVLIVGPTGIGKSRLCHELRHRLEERGPITAFEGRGDPTQGRRAWHVMAGALRTWLESPEGTPEERVRAALLERLPSSESSAFLGEILGTPFPETEALRCARADPAVMHDRLLGALGDLFETLTAAGPVALLLDDLQAADGPSLDLLPILLRRLEERPLLIVGLTRSEPSGPLGELRRLVVGSLSRRATARLARSILGSDAPDSVCGRIIERSAGNPYFVEELSLGVREGQRDLPSSVESAVQARLDALPRVGKDLLRRASVLGKRFWCEALTDLGQPGPWSILSQLRRAEMVEPEPKGRLLGLTEWRFRHALVQEVAYRSLTDDQRAALHLAAGRWLARRPDAPAVEVARHLDAGGDRVAAAKVWLRAAETAFPAGDTVLALEASSRALEHPLPPEDELQLRFSRAEAFLLTTSWPDLETELGILDPRATSPEHRAKVLWLRASRARALRDFEGASRDFAEGLRLAPHDARLLLGKALHLAEWGRATEGLPVARVAVEEARALGDPGVLGRALAALAFCQFSAGDLGAAAASYSLSLEASTRAGDLRRCASVQVNSAALLVSLGQPASAIALLESALTLTRTCGSRQTEGYALVNLAAALRETNELASASDRLARAESLAEEAGLRSLALTCARTRLGLLLDEGRAVEAAQLAARTLAAHEGSLGLEAILLRAKLAAALLAQGKRDEARVQAQAALDSRAGAGSGQDEVDLFLTAHEAGIEGALEQGVAVLTAKADRIADPALRASFLSRRAHERLVALAAASGLAPAS